ncbi:isochorismatase family protein [Streptomyces sp. M10(2022)]
MAGQGTRYAGDGRRQRGRRSRPRLPREPGDHLLVKKGASAFSGTSLATTLTSLRCDTTVVCGATTSGCVRATAVDSVQSGFPCWCPGKRRRQGPGTP